jgi:hypothetical protein
VLTLPQRRNASPVRASRSPRTRNDGASQTETDAETEAEADADAETEADAEADAETEADAEADPAGTPASHASSANNHNHLMT